MPLNTIQQGALEYLTAPNIPVPHCFTTRLGGISQGIFSSLNIGLHRGDQPENVAKNFRILADALHFSENNLILAHQTHSDTVRLVTKADHMGMDHHLYPECDALITCDPGTVLVVFTADCTPILLYDPVSGAVGAVHAGWRGTAAGLCAKTVEAMADHFGTDPKNIRAAIGPNIGQCCFATDMDVPTAMVESYGSEVWQNHIRKADDKYYVNLKEINALSLRNAGVEAIEISTDCTMCSPDRFWSHRYTRGKRGSQGAIIVCKEGRG